MGELMISGQAIRRWVLRSIAGCLVIAVVVTAGTAFRVWQVARIDRSDSAEAIVVLGAAQYNGKPSSVLQARLAHAVELYEAGVAPLVVTTGGARDGDAFSEADAGAMWLRDRGVPESDTVALGEGIDTFTSLDVVETYVDQRDMSSVVVVSDPWHSLRARTMAGDLGLEAVMSPTRTGPVVRTREVQVRYILRETAAVLYYRLWADSAEDLGDVGLG